MKYSSLLGAVVATAVILLPAVSGAWAAGSEASLQEPAAKPKDPQSSFEPRTGPGAGQKIMERMVGDWEVRKTISPPGKEPSITRGTCRQIMINEGRFLQSDFVFEEKDGTKTIGKGILGFDPATGLFTSVWVDSRSTRMSLRQSEGTFDGEQVILFGKGLEGGPPARRSRTIAVMEDKDRRLVHRQYSVGPDGKEFVIMELMMTRK